jgi:SAM-dependent methyltransferase
MNEQKYVGGELDLFAQARNWKGYWASKVLPWIKGDVLEVGAGIGSNTVLLRGTAQNQWLCLEPDPALATRLEAKLHERSELAQTAVRAGTISSLAGSEGFDTILYIDVLEHVQDDGAELGRAAAHLRPSGHLIVLSPAHQFLFSPFDRAIGHYRRYTLGQLRQLTPPGLRLQRGFYLDSVGLLASSANRLLLRQSLPRASQLAFWDKLMIPASRLLDPLTGYRLGKSVVCVWTNEK